MNLFVAGAGAIDTRALEQALRGVVERLPFFPGRPVHRWVSPDGDCAFAWVTHAPDTTGGVQYAHVEDERFAMFAGRPFRWVRAPSADLD